MHKYKILIYNIIKSVFFYLREGGKRGAGKGREGRIIIQMNRTYPFTSRMWSSIPFLLRTVSFSIYRIRNTPFPKISPSGQSQILVANARCQGIPIVKRIFLTKYIPPPSSAVIESTVGGDESCKRQKSKTCRALLNHLIGPLLQRSQGLSCALLTIPLFLTPSRATKYRVLHSSCSDKYQLQKGIVKMG